MDTKSIIDAILRAEGSAYTNDPKDSGGPTKYGITLKALQDYRGVPCTSVDVQNLTEAEARKIYLDKYFLKPKFDLIHAVSAKIAAELMDTGVNVGPGRAVRLLQRLLNLLNRAQKDYKDITVDGSIGLGTVEALRAFLRVRGVEGERVLLVALNCLQGAFYADLAEAREKDESFFYGWLKERVVHQIV